MIIYYRRVITIEEGMKIKETYDISLFLETSAKNGFNIYELFFQAAKILYEDYIEKHKINDVSYNYLI